MTTTDYRYTASGLDNVILKGLPVVIDDAGEAMVQIPAINDLHRFLAREVAMKPAALLPKEIRFLRTELGMTQAQLASVVGRDAQTIGRWERGETAPEQADEMVVRMLALEHLADKRALPTMESLAGMTMAAAAAEPFLIDASDPPHYRALERAAA